MSFLNSNNSEYLSARITNKGRKAIAQGNFNIVYFQIGDSEYDYNGMFTGLTGVNSHQKILTPFDYESGVKYPFNLDSSGTTTYGVPVENPNPKTDTIRNVMGPAGFVSNFKISGNTTIETLTNTIPYSQFTGGKTLTVTKSVGTTYYGCEYVTVIYDTLSGTTITGNSNSMIYKVTALSGTTGDTTQTITLDRNTQVLTGLTGNAQIICNKKEFESNSGDLLNPLDFEGQLNPWSLDVVWGEKPIGSFSGTSENISGFMGTRYVSAKEFYGYTSSGQTFTDSNKVKIETGFTSTAIGTSYINSFGEEIEVPPSEQRVIAVIHYSELSDLNIDLERSYKYDDYISYKTGTTGSDASIVEDYDRENDLRDLSDSEYFEVYIPFLNYHRNTSSTMGARFYMDTTNYYVRSTKNAYHQLLYRYLLDEVGNKVGKVFVNNKTIVFDDQELVAALDYRSNRRYTLPAPKISLVPSDGIPANSMLSDGSNMAWITYMFEYTSGNTFNSLPCNYYGKASLSVGSDGCVIATPSQVTMKFGSDVFSNMYTGFTSITDGFVANKFYALVQLVTTGRTPATDGWRIIDLTSQIPNHVLGTTINRDNLRNKTFTIYYSGYTGASYFDLETHMTGVTSDYMGQPLSVTTAQFGDTQPFPGSVRLIRATDIEELNFLVNLPSTQFLSSQNPNQSGDKFITEVALLDSKKEPLVVAKTPIPIKRIGNQVFAIKLDF
jgi:hypothetical protein